MYDGVEYDMLSLQDADCILVSAWNGQTVSRVLIDGGNKGDAEKVRSFLSWLNISRLDAVLSTHGHDDHSGGLIELLADETLEIGLLLSHVPHWHVSSIDAVKKALRDAGSSPEADAIRKTFETAASLYNIAANRKIPHAEPFEGREIGGLHILGPSVEFYNELVKEFSEADSIRAEAAKQARYDEQTAREERLEKAGLIESSSLLDEPHTSPENESSVITWAQWGNQSILLTADAGLCALTKVADKYDVANPYSMQIPHHGSRRNLNKKLIEHFSPTYALVSATGNAKHPRRAIVNAFKGLGTKVYSTHYPNPENLHHYIGTVPPRTGSKPATPLWEADVLAKRVGA
jgi:beta-lactamase superfamily II metal-dependent hydrolase